MKDKPQPNHEKPASDAANAARTGNGDLGTPEAAAAAQGVNENPEQAGDSATLSLREQLEAARAERDANYNLYLRSQAELQNYRKRVQREADEMRQYQALPLARDLLPALDNLHRALAVAENSKSVDELVAGVRMVAKQLETALGRHDVMPIEAAGKPFDPNLHQAIQQVPTAEHPPMTVVQEVERGFTLKDRVVRPATVIVAKEPPQAESEPATDVE